MGYYKTGMKKENRQEGKDLPAGNHSDTTDHQLLITSG